MPISPDSLYNITLNFLSINVQNIESLDGFPSLIGAEIFKRFVQRSEFVASPSQRQVKILKTFTHAYNSEVLEALKLPESLIVINEYLDPIIELSRFVTELCLCSCYLGNNHELFDYISIFDRLKRLCLRKNCLKDDAVRKITIRIRTFNKGPKELEYLDLSENQLTDAIIRWLPVFVKLKFLNLSNCQLTEKGVKRLERDCNLNLITTCDFYGCFVDETKGWATHLVEKWRTICISRRHSREMKMRSTFFFLKKRYETVRSVEKDYKPLVFTRAGSTCYSSSSSMKNYQISKDVNKDDENTEPCERQFLNMPLYNLNQNFFSEI